MRARRRRSGPVLLFLAILVVFCGAGIVYLRQAGTLPAWAPAFLRTGPVSQPGAIAAGLGFSIALDPDGTVWGWGRYARGTDAEVRYLTPSPVAALQDVIAVTANPVWAGALTRDGHVYQWGPARWLVDGLPPISTLRLGNRHGLAVAQDHSVWTWTWDEKQKAPSPPTARPVSGLSDIVAIAAGRDFSLAVDRSGAVWAWGDNKRAQLGQPGVVQSPARVPGLPPILSVAAGDDYSVALARDGSVWVWGFNWPLGGLSDDKNPDHNLPPTRTNLSDVAFIAAARNYGVVIKRDGRAYTWGSDPANQRDIALKHDHPLREVPGVTNVVEAAPGADHTLFRTRDGRIIAWGSNGSGQLGDPTYPGDGNPRAITLKQQGSDKALPGLPAVCVVREVPVDLLGEALAAHTPDLLKSGSAFPKCIGQEKAADGKVVLITRKGAPDGFAVVAWREGENWAAAPIPLGKLAHLDLATGKLSNGRPDLTVIGYWFGSKWEFDGTYHLTVDAAGKAHLELIGGLK